MNEIAETYKGYSTFIEVANRSLRAFNQWNVLNSMRDNKLFQLMEDYMDFLSKDDKLGLMVIAEYIKAKGLEETKRELIAEGVMV